MKNHLLEIKNLHAGVEDLSILKGVNLDIKVGEVHAIMGPNGSGKSTLSKVIMGHPDYIVSKGDIRFKTKSILNDPTDLRARKGIFLAFQQPREIAGVTLSTFMRNAQKKIFEEKNIKAPTLFSFKKYLRDTMDELKMPHHFAERYINFGFSGGEKKKTEILQMSTLDPDLVILDEIDSGLDVDALRIVASAVNNFQNRQKAVLIITHYQRILDYIQPTHVHVIIKGKIVKSGSGEFARQLEEEGYEKYFKHEGLNMIEN